MSSKSVDHHFGALSPLTRQLIERRRAQKRPLELMSRAIFQPPTENLAPSSRTYSSSSINPLSSTANFRTIAFGEIVSSTSLPLEKISEAIVQEDVGALRVLLQDVDINNVKIQRPDSEGIIRSLSCLHWAIYLGKESVVRYFIEERSAKVDSELELRRGGKPALLLALSGDPTRFGSPQFIQFLQYLRGKGAVLNSAFYHSDGSRVSLVSYYAQQGDFQRLSYLVESLSPNVNLADSKGNTPLYYVLDWAGRKERVSSIVNFLLDYDAHLECKDADGNTLLMKFAEKGHWNAVSELLSIPADATETDDTGKNALVHALNAYSNLSSKNDGKRQDFERIISALSTYESRKSIMEKLQEQMDLENTASVDFLCRLGVNHNCRSSKGETPLIYFARKGYLKGMAHLLSKGVSVIEKDDRQKTALMYIEKWKHRQGTSSAQRASFAEMAQVLKSATN